MDKHDYLSWMSENLKIVDMGGNVVNLRPNTAQQMVHGAFQLQHAGGYPVRVIIVKARRTGISTYVQGRFFCDVNRFSNRIASVASADEEATHKVFTMSKMFQKRMPCSERLKTVRSNRKEIVYADPHSSSFRAMTAGKDVLGRGGLTHYLHCSEFAYWRNAKQQLGGAAQEIPDRPGTAVVIERTANGVGDAFYDMFWDACESWKKTKDLNNYIPLFLSWTEFPDYQMKIPSQVDFQVGLADCPDEWLEDEHELSGKGVSDNQLYWRRWAIKNKCQSDISLFRQEYPFSSKEAFQFTGRRVFLSSVLKKQRRNCSPERYYGIFNKEGQFEPVDRKKNCWIGAEFPGDEEYTMGIDTMGGRSVDPSSARSGTDLHGAAVFARSAQKYVAIYSGTGPQLELGNQCLNTARAYNNAFVAPEIPKAMEVLLVFKEAGYSNIYNRQVHDEQMAVEFSDNLGWRTTTTTRPWLVQSFLSALSDDNFCINFPEILDEMDTFIYDKMGKPIHNIGKHDDLLFGAMIALQAHVRCPLSNTYLSNFTGDRFLARDLKSLAYANAVDTDDEYDWYEDEFTD